MLRYSEASGPPSRSGQILRGYAQDDNTEVARSALEMQNRNFRVDFDARPQLFCRALRARRAWRAAPTAIGSRLSQVCGCAIFENSRVQPCTFDLAKRSQTRDDNAIERELAK